MTNINKILEEDSTTELEVQNVSSISQAVKNLEKIEGEIDALEKKLSAKKDEFKKLSEDEIPNLLEESGVSEIKTTDGTTVSIQRFYSARITEDNRDECFRYLEQNGLGDIIKNEILVSFGRNEDNKAAEYAELAKGQGFQPTQKMKVEPMTLKALVRERIEAGKEMPTEIFGVFSENKTTIKRNK